MYVIMPRVVVVMTGHWMISAVASCVPNISLTPNKPDTLCRGSDDTVRFKVTAFFQNYTQWKLEKSIDNGATWTSPGIDTMGNAACRFSYSGI